MEDLYIRHDTLDLDIPEEVFIVGCGGTGAWMGIICAMIGVNSINLFDDDIIENHNRSRLPYPEEWVGKKKTEALRDFIRWIRPECNIYINDGIRSQSDLIAITGKLVFDCNDNPGTQKMIFNHCKKHSLDYIGIGCNSNHITIISNLDSIWIQDENDPYDVTPIYLVPPMVSSLCALWNVVHKNRDISCLMDMKNIFGIDNKKDNNKKDKKEKDNN